MVFPITCNAFGDIYTIASIVYQICMALDKSRGSTADYQNLAATLEQSKADLQAMSSNIVNVNVDPRLIASINSYLALCLSVVEGFEKRIQRYDATLGKKPARRNLVVRNIRKLDWHLFMRNESVKMLQKLNQDRTSMATHLTSLLLDMYKRDMQQVKQMGGQTTQTLDSVHNVGIETRDMVKDLHSKMDQAFRLMYEGELHLGVGYSNQNAVVFVDVLGTRMTVPMELCADWTKFDDFVKFRFAGPDGRARAGNAYVQRGAYEISRTIKVEGVSYDDVIDPEKWALAVQVGAELAMGIVIRRAEPAATSSDKVCPRCRKDNSQTNAIGGWIECWYCDGRFCVSEEEADLDARDAEGPSQVQEVNEADAASRHEAKRVDATAADVALFKWIHLVNVTLGVLSLVAELGEDGSYPGMSWDVEHQLWKGRFYPSHGLHFPCFSRKRGVLPRR